MLDLGLSKLAIIGVVALVVIGPEKLPRVARTAGALLGRAQRYINDVKSEVAREMDMSDLKQARSDFETAARSMHSSVHEKVTETESQLNDTWRSLNPEPSPDSEAGLPAPASNPSGYSVYDDGGRGSVSSSYGTSYLTRGDASASGKHPGAARRRNWRIKQAAPPAWFKRTQIVRTRLQSGAARVARHRPSDVRTPTRFL